MDHNVMGIVRAEICGYGLGLFQADLTYAVFEQGKDLEGIRIGFISYTAYFFKHTPESDLENKSSRIGETKKVENKPKKKEGESLKKS
jgi:hypothetical protein